MAELVPKTADHSLATAPTVESDGPASVPAPPIDDPLLGRALHHFRIDAHVGAGGMGTVYRGWDSALERPVAIKVLPSTRPEARARFLREARTQAKLRHPNVVPIHFVGEADGVAFLSMDLVEGESLADRLARERRLAPTAALRIARDVASALAAGVAAGLVHRDVKPSNILIEPSGRVLLADFGLAKTVASAEPDANASGADDADPQLTHRGAVLGTPAYMAPEQTRGDPCDQRADIYALGVTLYQALTGELPFTAPTTGELLEQHRTSAPLPPRTLAPELPPAVEALVIRMMSKRPEDRFPDHAALTRAVDEALSPPLHSAGLMSRAGAFAVDMLVFAIPAAIVSGLVHEALGWPVFIVAFGIVEGRWGRSLGKYLLALRTVGPHDTAPGYLRSFARAALKLWGPTLIPMFDLIEHAGVRSALQGLVAIAWLTGLAIAAGKRKAALHDRALQTRVVYALHSHDVSA